MRVFYGQVLVHFSDNYDYQDIRKDYIHNEVQNIAMDWGFYAYVLDRQYAARIQDVRTYAGVSRDIISR